jgi:hypothetical protein
MGGVPSPGFSSIFKDADSSPRSLLPVQMGRRLFAVTVVDSKELIPPPAHICPLSIVIESDLTRIRGSPTFSLVIQR